MKLIKLLFSSQGNYPSQNFHRIEIKLDLAYIRLYRVGNFAYSIGSIHRKYGILLRVSSELWLKKERMNPDLMAQSNGIEFECNNVEKKIND